MYMYVRSYRTVSYPGCDPAVLGVPDEEASVVCKNTAYLDGVKLQDGSGRVCYSATSPGSVAAYICENGYSGNHTDVTVCGTNLVWMSPKTCVGEFKLRPVTLCATKMRVIEPKSVNTESLYVTKCQIREDFVLLVDKVRSNESCMITKSIRTESQPSLHVYSIISLFCAS